MPTRQESGYRPERFHQTPFEAAEPVTYAIGCPVIPNFDLGQTAAMRWSQAADHERELQWRVEGARPQGGLCLALKHQRERGVVSTSASPRKTPAVTPPNETQQRLRASCQALPLHNPGGCPESRARSCRSGPSAPTRGHSERSRLHFNRGNRLWGRRLAGGRMTGERVGRATTCPIG